MASRLITALDIGSSTIQTLVAEHLRGESLRILGMGVSDSSAVRRGVVIDVDEAGAAIRRSVADAEKSAGVPIKSVWLGVSGTPISVASSRGVVAISRPDGEVSPDDVRRVITAAETFVARNPNKEILHMIPRNFKIDNESNIKDPVGMHGVRLEVDTLIIETSSSALKNLMKSVEMAGLHVEDYVFGPLAASYAVLSKRAREMGAALLDIGGGLASFVVFEEGTPLHAGVLPIGGNLITNDVAIGFRTHIDIAERIKLTYGSCLPEELSKRDLVRLAEFHAQDTSVYSRRELAEIIEARLRDIFELLQKELKKVDRKQLLPGGVVLVGGSSQLPGIVEMAKQEMALPAEIGHAEFVEFSDPVLAASFVTAAGILKWAEMKIDEPTFLWTGKIAGIAQYKWIRWLRSLLP